MNGFASEWLDTRYPFDAHARNSGLERMALNYLSRQSHPVIVDVGAGNGANLRYLIPRLPQTQQTWYWVDHDPMLRLAARENVLHRIWPDAEVLTDDEEQLVLQKGARQLNLHWRCHSLLDLGRVIDLHEAHLVTANAVFDLFTQEEFEAFARQLHCYRLPLYATLNYLGMSFDPISPDDEEAIRYYEAHMQREQAAGVAMGPECVPQMISAWRKVAQAAVWRGPSAWRIGRTDQEMLRHLLFFMQQSIPAMLSTPDQKQRMQQWLEQKSAAITQEELSLMVQHEDLILSWEGEIDWGE